MLEINRFYVSVLVPSEKIECVYFILTNEWRNKRGVLLNTPLGGELVELLYGL